MIAPKMTRRKDFDFKEKKNMMLMEKSCSTAKTQVTGAPDEDEVVLEERRGNSTER